MPMLADEIRAEIRNGRVYALDVAEEAVIVAKRIELGRKTIAYEWSEGRAEIVVPKHDFDSAAIGERIVVRVDPNDPTYSVSRFDQKSDGVFPSAIAFAPLIGLVFLGLFLAARSVRRLRLLLRGTEVDFEITGPRTLFGFPVRWGRYSRLIDLPVRLSPVPEEPASDAILLVDPQHPDRCIAARRGMFREPIAWSAVAEKIRRVLRDSEVALSPELRADLEIEAEEDEAKAWASVVDGHLRACPAVERWLESALSSLPPADRIALGKLSCIRALARARTRRIKSSFAFGTAWVTYLATIGATGEVYWTMPVLGAAPLLYVLIGWLGVEDR
jgi:hypothetical protein